MASNHRIGSLDQFRGYTVAGMLLVNFLGGYAAWPGVLKHHNTYCSYADTIMPQFVFAVGFAYRLTFLRRAGADGPRAAVVATLRRSLGLLLVGFVVYHLDGGVKSWDELRALGVRGFVATAFRRELFQTLVHIALTTLWVLPVIGAGAAARWAYLGLSAALHLGLSSMFYFEHAWKTPVIDGGPLGFLSWTTPLLVGSLAYDVVRRGGAGGRTLGTLAAWAIGLMAAGYALAALGGPVAFDVSAHPVTLWTMSQRTGSVSYLTFASGFSVAVYALFVLACDRGGRALGLFRTFGTNALAAYVLHGLVAAAVKPWVPRDAPGWYVAAGFFVYFGINYLFVRNLETNRLFLKL